MSERQSIARQAQAYQIDFTAVASGKRIASSKRRVRWRFGFANPRALAAGQTGTACRGEEHDITLVWSVTSGKRLVLADGKEVHYSHSRNSIFDYSWTIRGNHVLKIVAHAAPPMAMTPGFRQYDFFVNGQSFFSMPKLYRLGLAPGDPRAVASPSSPAALAERGNRYSERENIAEVEAPHNPDEEELYLQEAIRQSLEDDIPQNAARKESRSDSYADLLDFGTQPAPAPAYPTAPSDPFGAAAGYSQSGLADSFGAQPAQIAATAWNAPSSAAYPSSNGYGQGSYAAPAPPATYDPWSQGQAAPAPGANGSWQAPAQTGAIVPAATQASPWAATQQYPGQAATVDSNAASSWNGQSSASTTLAWNGGQPAPQAAQYPAASWNGGQTDSSAQYQSANWSGQTTGVQNPASTWTAPAPVATNFAEQGYGGVPSSVTPQAQATPSTIGFGSPAPNFNSFSTEPGIPENAPVQNEYVTTGATNAQEQEASANASSEAELAYAKLMNMDTFTVSSKNDAARSNPFETTNDSIGGSLSLADIQARKDKLGPAKPIMNTAASGAMVASNQQNSSYGSQYGVQPMQQQAAYGQQQQSDGQQQYGQAQQQYGQPQQQYVQASQQATQQYGQTPQQYGQQPSQQAQYGMSTQQPTYGQPPQQPQYGQPAFQQQPQYGVPAQQGYY